MFSDRHQLSKSSFQWFDSIKITPVERLKGFVPRFFYIYCWSLHLISWKSCLEFSTRALCRRFDVGWAMLRNKHGSHSRRSDSSREKTPKECGICAWNKHFQRAIAVSKFGLSPKVSHRIESVNFRKNGIGMQILLRSLDHLDWRTLFVGSSTYA